MYYLQSGEKGFTPVNEAVDTFTFRYPSAEVCTTSVSSCGITLINN